MKDVDQSRGVPEHSLKDFYYHLPDYLIAQQPLPERSQSRLLNVDGFKTSHHSVKDLPHLLEPGDHLIFNDTRVVPARVFGNKETGGRIELMLERVMSNGHILAKIRASKSPKIGSRVVLTSKSKQSHQQEISVPTSIIAEIVQRHDDLFELRAEPEVGNLATFIEVHGEIPLPPYIDRPPNDNDQERYQTIYADKPGAVAAPTAGLHFDEKLFSELQAKGIHHSFITLHVGAGTFQPVRVDNPDDHVMHAERVTVPKATVNAIKHTKAKGGRVIAVGTTCVRALEAASQHSGELEPFQGETRLFLTPGVRFNTVDGMFTNFHLPESTLLMLVAAFAGLEETLAAYREAVKEKYRFFSYGDAMLVWPQKESSL